MAGHKTITVGCADIAGADSATEMKRANSHPRDRPLAARLAGIMEDTSTTTGGTWILAMSPAQDGRLAAV